MLLWVRALRLAWRRGLGCSRLGGGLRIGLLFHPVRRHRAHDSLCRATATTKKPPSWRRLMLDPAQDSAEGGADVASARKVAQSKRVRPDGRFFTFCRAGTATDYGGGSSTATFANGFCKPLFQTSPEKLNWLRSQAVLERAMGIEPTALAWEARVLPLYDARRTHDSTRERA
jgi:hypothetical protein